MTKRTWIRCRYCRGRMLVTFADGIAAVWCAVCDRYRPEDDR